MKKHLYTAGLILCQIIFFAFSSLAEPKNFINSDREYEYIKSFDDKVVEHINKGSARSHISRDAVKTDLGEPYRIFSCNELFERDTANIEEIEDVLEKASYIWQVPVKVGDVSLLIDITKTTEIRDDIPEEAKEKLRENLGKWHIGATYIYGEENVNYVRAVEDSLETYGLNPEDYTYEFVNGIPGIRYPVALVCNKYRG